MRAQAKNVSIVGTANHQYEHIPFGIKQADRRFHVLITGQTGTGKSTLLHNLAVQDYRAKRHFCLIEPHGDLAEQVRDAVGDDVIYWNVADPDTPYGYNPLIKVSEAHRPLVASGLIEALKKQWGSDGWGPRMEHLLRYSLLALLEQPSASLQDIGRLFVDKSFRFHVVNRLTDPQTLYFWKEEFPSMNYKNASDGYSALANKLGSFLAHPVVRKAVCDPEQPLRFRKLMDEGPSLIINLAKGRLGADNANVLGGMLLASITNAAFSRHDTPEEEREPYYLKVDEFTSFSTTTFANILSEARKYALSVTMASQYTKQMEPEVLEAVFGNVGTNIVFRLGVHDAPIFQRQLQTPTEADLMNQRNHEAFVRLMVDGHKIPTFSAMMQQAIRGE